MVTTNTDCRCQHVPCLRQGDDRVIIVDRVVHDQAVRLRLLAKNRRRNVVVCHHETTFRASRTKIKLKVSIWDAEQHNLRRTVTLYDWARVRCGVRSVDQHIRSARCRRGPTERETKIPMSQIAFVFWTFLLLNVNGLFQCSCIAEKCAPLESENWNELLGFSVSVSSILICMPWRSKCKVSQRSVHLCAAAQLAPRAGRLAKSNHSPLFYWLTGQGLPNEQVWFRSKDT